MPLIATCSGSKGCGRQWSGTVQAHCTVCHEHFSTVNNFDKHEPNRRGCKKPAEMTRKKLDGTVVPVFKGVEERYGVTWVGWSEDTRFTENENEDNPE